MRKGRIKYYFKNKKAVINDVGKLCDMNEQLEQELERYKNIINEATKELEKLLPLCIMPNNTLIHATEKSKIIEKTIKILKGE